jgi:hypothetical protein
MRINRIAISLLIAVSNLIAVTTANAMLIPNPDGARVYDTFLKVTWAANANLPGTKDNNFDGALGLPTCDKGIAEPCVDPNGAMSYTSAVYWLEILNGLHGLPPFLGHSKWTIPRTPETDPNCTVRNWGYNCMDSALGSLYYRSLPSGNGNFGFTYPDTTVPIPDNQVGPFRNFQPYLYWTSTGGNGSGQSTFSFNTGWQGSNHKFHYMYALPMISGKIDRPGISYVAVGPNDLQVSSDGQLVWDPDAVDPSTGAAGVTWLADANLAKTHKFGLKKCESHHRLCINPDGSMKYTTAQTWLANMNNYDNGTPNRGWLEQNNWELPAADPAGGCDFPQLHCLGGPMGELYFNELGLHQGTPVFQLPTNVGPFFNLQPYLYWACAGPDPCQGPPPPHGTQSWSFSFGNGFQGTDIVHNNLYVMVYYPQTPPEALNEGIRDELANYPSLRNQLLAEAAQISSATTLREMLIAFNLFTTDVDAHRSHQLSSAQADYLIALAQATADARNLQPPPPPCAPHCI